VSVKLYRVFRVINDELIPDWPAGSTQGPVSPGGVIGPLTRLPAAEPPTTPPWRFLIRLGNGSPLDMTFEPFMTAAEHRASLEAAINAAELGAFRWRYSSREPDPHDVGEHRRIWFFHDSIYLADTLVLPQDVDEAMLQVKALHYQRGQALRRLREQVANFEAAENYVARGVARRPLPDDVKLLVWARDGGACVRCGGRSDLHFDHIIPLAKGGSDAAENIQILCEHCNLAKGASIT